MMASIGNNTNGHARQAVFAGGSASGRWFVIAGLLALLVIFGAVYLAFLDWRTRYRALAEFGAMEVAPLVDPLASRVPSGVDPEAWRRAVDDTHDMLLALTSAGVLSRSQLETIRAEVASRVARSTPATTRDELIALWDDLERRAGPVLAPDVTPPPRGSRHAARHPRPARPELLQSNPSLKPD
jgi:hypothetical protein